MIRLETSLNLFFFSNFEGSEFSRSEFSRSEFTGSEISGSEFSWSEVSVFVTRVKKRSSSTAVQGSDFYWS